MPDGINRHSQFNPSQIASAVHQPDSHSGRSTTALSLYSVAGQTLGFTDSFHVAVERSIEADSKKFALVRLAEYWSLISAFAEQNLVSQETLEQLQLGLNNDSLAGCKLWYQAAVNESLNSLSSNIKDKLTEAFSAVEPLNNVLPRAMNFLWYGLSVETANNHLTKDRDQLVLKYMSADYFLHVFLDFEKYPEIVQAYLLRSLGFLLRHGGGVDSLLVSDYFDGHCTSFTMEECQIVTAFVEELRAVVGEDIVASEAVTDFLKRLETPELKDFNDALLDIVYIDMDDLSSCDDSLNQFMNSVYEIHQKILIGNRYKTLNVLIPKTDSISDLLALPWPIEEAPELCEKVRAVLSFSDTLPYEQSALQRMDDADYRFGVVICPFSGDMEEQLHHEVYEMHLSEDEAEDAFYVDVSNQKWFDELSSYIMATAATAIFCLACNDSL